MNKALILAVEILMMLIVSCRGGLVSTSKRDLVFSQSGDVISRSRKISTPDQPPEIFIRKKKIVVNPVRKGLKTGSLYQMEDPRNLLFVEKPRGFMGEHLDILIDSSRMQKEDLEKKEQPNEGSDNQDKSLDQLEKTLLQALPDLNAGKDNPVLLREIKFQVSNRLPNGDAIVTSSRRSSNRGESNSIEIVARIPFKVLQEKRSLTTRDLFDVDWAESSDGEFFERHSTSWEDEYTLRLSGFSEAKSKAALSLQEKKKQLNSIRNKMEIQLKNMSLQRAKISKERKRLGSIRARFDEEKKSLEDKVEEQREQLETRLKEKKELESELKEAQDALNEQGSENED